MKTDYVVTYAMPPTGIELSVICRREGVEDGRARTNDLVYVVLHWLSRSR